MKRGKEMKNVFTIDTEEWFHANYEDGLFSNEDSRVSLIEEEVERLLEIFENNQVKATFFILGYVAEKHPDLIRKIAMGGHEIASHGYGHQLVYKQSPDEFREDVLRSKLLLEDITGQKIIGYRAPSWSITEQSLWALDILDELGFEYASSVFPTKNFLYGIPYAPRFKHNCEVYGKENLKIVNIPPSTIKVWNINIPFSGGAYFRLLPSHLINLFAKRVNEIEKQPVVFYLHPREIDPRQPKLELRGKDFFIHYYGVRNCEKKLINVLSKYEFTTAAEMLRNDNI